jgi:hypothetical protein
MSMFNIQSHHFGEVVYLSNHCINIQYLGDNNLTDDMFVKPCGCTASGYNAKTKTLNICLSMNSRPTKEASVICNIPEGQEVIFLSANVNV